METKNLSTEDAKNKAAEMIGRLCPLILATIADDGFPDLRALALGANDDLQTIWFSTSIVSKKVTQLRVSPYAAVYGADHDGFSELRLFGTVEILTDMESKKKVWKDDYVQYWPEGIESSDMVVLKFTTVRGEFSSAAEHGEF